MGAAMGWTVHDVKRSSMWEFFAAWHGFVAANTPKETGKLSEDDKDRIWERMQELEGPSSAHLSTQTYWWDENGPVPMGVVSFTLN